MAVATVVWGSLGVILYLIRSVCARTMHVLKTHNTGVSEWPIKQFVGAGKHPP